MYKTRNNQSIDIKNIPVQTMTDAISDILSCASNGNRPILMFTDNSKNPNYLYIVIANDSESSLSVFVADCTNIRSYPSMSNAFPAFHLFERELWEETGIFPEGHPWLKPVRYAYDRNKAVSEMIDYPFYAVNGEEIHEVGVGPVHAGVIEPGHFRFQCKGEDVLHLEIQLGYQHRGIERMFEHAGFKNLIPTAESIAGDSVMAHTWAHAQCLENLMGIMIPKRADHIRAIALEMERAAIHIGDLGAIANDIAYQMGMAVFSANRTLIINSSLLLCGSRLSRGLIKYGGVHFDIDDEKCQTLVYIIDTIEKAVSQAAEVMFATPSVLSRLEKTGTVEQSVAAAIGMVGPAARASGLPADIRTDHSYGPYSMMPIHMVHLESGDVYARTYIRYLEIKESFRWIRNALQHLPATELCIKPTAVMPNKLSLSITEGWRGETVHAAVTDTEGTIVRYKIKDPSFNNWFALALAVRNNAISDFPLCNKSFNLSYCGHDL